MKKILKKYLNKESIKFNFLGGTIDEIDKIAPSYINLKNPKYIDIDNMFFSGLIVVNYYREQEELILKNLIETNINMDVSIFYEKKDEYQTIKDLT